MLDLLMGVVSGGATGIIGSAIGGVFKFLGARQAAKEKAAERSHELDLQRLQISARDAETENELAILTTQSASDQLRDSYQHDATVGATTPLIAGVLRMVRPLLTFVLIALTATIYFTLDSTVLAQGVDLQARIVNTVVYTTSAAVLWWFGDRASSLKK